MAKLTATLSLCAASSVVAFALVFQTGRRLLIDGNDVSDNLVQRDGRYWVPVDDVARYFGYGVTIDQNGATLTRTGSSTTGNSQVPIPPTAPVGTIAPATGNPNVPPPNLGNGPTVAPASGVPPVGAPQVFSNTSMVYQPEVTVPPTQIKVGLGQTASVNGFDYRVADIRPVGSRYKEQFDQRARTLHAKYRSDSLVVVDIDETNRGTEPVQAVVPDPSQVSVYGPDGVGYEASFIDVRQSPQAVDGSWGYEYDMYREFDLSANAVSLAPGGTLRFAVVASVPSNDPINSASMNFNSTVVTVGQ